MIGKFIKEHIIIITIIACAVVLIWRIVGLDSNAVLPFSIVTFTPLITSYLFGLSGKKLWVCSVLALVIGFMTSVFELDYYSKFEIAFLSRYMLCASLVVFSAGRYYKKKSQVENSTMSVSEESQLHATLKLSKGKLLFLFYTALLIGIQLDIHVFGGFLDRISTMDIIFVFTVLLYVAVLIKTIYLLQPKRRVEIIATSMAINLYVNLIFYFIFESNKGHLFDPFGVFYFIRALFIPSLIMAACYGLCLYSLISKNKIIQVNIF